MAKDRKKPKKSPGRKPRTRAEKNAAKRETDPLTDQERLFVAEYIVHRNGLRAYKKVYGGISYSSAAVGASNLLKRANIRAEINAFIKAQGLRTRITADRVLREVGRLAFSDIVDLMDDEGNFLSPRDIPLELRKAIAGIEVARERRYKDGEEEVKESIVKYKLWDKNAALGKLMKHLGLETELTPLDALLQVLPAEVGTMVREALARSLGKVDEERKS